jgi:hypothetical protein
MFPWLCNDIVELIRPANAQIKTSGRSKNNNEGVLVVVA